MELFFEKLILFRPVFQRISNGELLRPIMAWLFRVVALLVVLLGLYVVVQLLRMMSGHMAVRDFFSIVLLVLVDVLSTFVVFNVLLIRAHEILHSSVNDHYPLVPLLIVVLKTAGETLAAYGILLGVGIYIASLLATGLAALVLLPVLAVAPFFPVLGIAAFFQFNYLAELLRVSTDTAIQTKR